VDCASLTALPPRKAKDDDEEEGIDYHVKRKETAVF